MPRVIVIGGGLAGLAASAALGSAGYSVELYEARPFLGGRATSFPVSPGEEDSELIDNCQHVLLGCCVNLQDFYRRLGVADRIHYHDKYYFLEPGGRMSTLARDWLPAPLHLGMSFLKMACLDADDKRAIGWGLLALIRERTRRQDLDRITMLDWLTEKNQTPRAIQRFWRQVLVSAVNEELDRMAAAHGFQVFWLGMLARRNGYVMGVPAAPLRELYDVERLRRTGDIQVHTRTSVERVEIVSGAVRDLRVAGERRFADYYVCAVPFERIDSLAPMLAVEVSQFQHSPITGIHLWFDRAITDLPHAALLDRTIQWMFNKQDGRYVQFVVSASRSLVEMSRPQVIELALSEGAEFFPDIRRAKLEKSHVVKEVRATFSAAPGLEEKRPPAKTSVNNLFLAGDWTRTRWPATMEGAVRSGYLAAEAVTTAAGKPRRFLTPETER